MPEARIQRKAWLNSLLAKAVKIGAANDMAVDSRVWLFETLEW